MSIFLFGLGLVLEIIGGLILFSIGPSIFDVDPDKPVKIIEETKEIQKKHNNPPIGVLLACAGLIIQLISFFNGR